MKTDTLNTDPIRQSKWYNESCLIEDNKQVYCRIYKQDFNTDPEAEHSAQLIATALNSCKEINKDNPLKVAESIEEMYSALHKIVEYEGFIHLNDSDAKKFIQMAKRALNKTK